MPFPRWLARVNLYFTNRLAGPFAGRLPGMGIVIHIGRKTHRPYRTPVLVFRRDQRLVIALTYGRESQWVQNVMAAGGCQLQTRNRTLWLKEPRLLHDQRRQAMPGLIRFFLGILNVSDFLELTVSHAAASP
jgi:deazaflavin-dependent oxidoreductase (nitroreductase family)